MLRLAWLALRAALGSAAGSLSDRLRSPAERASRRDARIARWGLELARILGDLRGPFAKAGQFASLRQDVLPPGLTGPLASLQDRVPPVPFEEVSAVIEEELGAPPDALFLELDAAPVAAASIAQVHRARLHDGREVAVKVQYPWIRDSLAVDQWLLKLLLTLGWRGSRRDTRARLLAEFEASLAEELDFRREAAVAREIALNLAGDPQIVVPSVIEALSGSRVLTMDYHSAARVDDREALARLDVAPREVLEIVARAYAQQVFVDGLFHADPHPGNLFVLPRDARGRARVLFVDFGLSKRLPDALRRQMRRALYALIQRRPDDFVAHMQELGILDPAHEEEVRSAVRHMFDRIAKRAGGAGTLGLQGGHVLGLKDEAKALLRETPGLQLPSELLLYAKTLSYLFALGERLDPDVDLMKLSLPYLLRFLAARD